MTTFQFLMKELLSREEWRNGQRKIFEKGETDTSDPLFVRVVANGTHFRGYINKEMIVHGHGDAPEPGSVGLKLDGNGTILLQKMEMVQL